MFAKVLAIFAMVSYSQAGYIDVYPGAHGATSYVKSVSNSYGGTPIYGNHQDLYLDGQGYGYGKGYGSKDYVDYYAYPKYKYAYGVDDPHTGDHKSQSEIRDGDVVKGYYTVAEPDGTKRIVHYTADDHNGFNAVVERIGHAVHPAFKTVIAQPRYDYGHGYGYGY